MTHRDHEWVTVKNRQWCLSCGAFQRRTSEAMSWEPDKGHVCRWDTPYARRKIALEKQPDIYTASGWPPICDHPFCRAAHAEALAQASDRAPNLRERERLFAESVAAHSAMVPCIEARLLRPRSDLDDEDDEGVS